MKSLEKSVDLLLHFGAGVPALLCSLEELAVCTVHS